MEKGRAEGIAEGIAEGEARERANALKEKLENARKLITEKGRSTKHTNVNPMLQDIRSISRKPFLVLHFTNLGAEIKLKLRCN